VEDTVASGLICYAMDLELNYAAIGDPYLTRSDLLEDGKYG